MKVSATALYQPYAVLLFQVRGEDAPMLSCKECRVVRCVYAATPVLCSISTGMLAVGWLTGRRGWVMQVLQCASPENVVGGRD